MTNNIRHVSALFYHELKFCSSKTVQWFWPLNFSSLSCLGNVQFLSSCLENELNSKRQNVLHGINLKNNWLPNKHKCFIPIVNKWCKFRKQSEWKCAFCEHSLSFCDFGCTWYRKSWQIKLECFYVSTMNLNAQKIEWLCERVTLEDDAWSFGTELLWCAHRYQVWLVWTLF